MDEYVRAGKLRVVFRPLAFLGGDSVTAATHAVAAGEQDKLWNVVELLYRNQGGENSGWVTHDLLTSLAPSVAGLDGRRLHADAQAAAAQAELDEAAAEAQGRGINGTRAFLVGPTGGDLERFEPRALDAAAFGGAIDALLR